MLTGFNTNVRYRGLGFHVQTEDGGRNRPRIVTHLFREGRILASLRTDYGDLLDPKEPDSADVEEAIRDLMQEQHKEMLRRLTRGEFDARIEVSEGDDPGERTGTALDPLAGDVALDRPGRPTLEIPVPQGARERRARAFGSARIGDRRLDEVIFGYLVDRVSGGDRSAP